LIVLVVILVLAIFFLIVDIIDINRFVVKEYEVKSDKLNKEIKIAFLSDLHNRQFGKENRKLIKAVEGYKPDFVICGGDMLTAIQGGACDRALSLFDNLKIRPVFHCLGNHENKMKIKPDEFGSKYEDYKRLVEDKGVTFLENNYSDIEEANVRIQGLMIEHKYYVKFSKNMLTPEHVRELTGKKDDSKFEIMLAHNPEYFPAYAEAGADLILSGHVHGGIMRLPFVGGVISPKLKLFPKFDGGIFHYMDSTMVLSRGLGCHTLPLRIFNPGELVVIRLIPKGD